MGSIFDDDVELIKDATVFEEDYTPREIVGRDEIIDDYIKVFKPIYKGRPPKNAYLHGDSGVGKTGVTKYLLNTLEDDIAEKNTELPEDDQIQFTSLRVNCKNLASSTGTTTSYQVAVKITNKLKPPGERISATGYAPQDVYQMMYEELDTVGGSIIIVLDEVDQLGRDDTIIYELPRARDNNDLEKARIGLIGISNDMTYHDKLSADAADSLSETPIKFDSYVPDQLQEILRQRAELGLYENTYSEEILSYCAALAMRTSSGSARRAIDLLYTAAEIAENKAAKEVTTDHLDEAEESLEYTEIVKSITGLGHQKRFILEAIARLEVANSERRIGNVHLIYSLLSEAWTGESLGQRQMSNHLNKIVSQGLVVRETENRGRDGGRYNTYSLSPAVEIDQVFEAMESHNQPPSEVDIDCQAILKKTSTPSKTSRN